MSKNAEETKNFGKKLAKRLKVNDIVALSGPLGAGKTTLIQGIAQGLGIKDYVTSPTFILINEFCGRLPLYHCDLYRLNNLTEIEDLGIEEYFAKGGVLVIEWAEKLGKLLPPTARQIKIKPLSETKREISVL